MDSRHSASGQVNQAVVAFQDGRRLKGYVFNFSATRESFRLFPTENAPPESGIEVKMEELKAVFFVKDFAGHPDYKESSSQSIPQHGHRIEVAFHDGETISGVTEGYNKQKLGFFVFPADPQSNNIRIFIINKNLRTVKMY